MAYKLGKDAVLKIGSTELKNIKDVSLNLSAESVDITTRKSGGWKEELVTLKTLEITFQALFDSEDTVFNSLQTAFMNGTTVDVEISGSGTLTATCVVSNFSITQALTDAITVDITLKPTAGEAPPTFTGDSGA